MTRYRKFEIRYLWDKGLSLVFYEKEDDPTGFGYFENGSTGSVDRSLKSGNDIPSKLFLSYRRCLTTYTLRSEEYDYSVKLVNTPGEDRLEFDVASGKEKCRVVLNHGGDWYDTCSCKRYTCRHKLVVMNSLSERIAKMMEEYVLLPDVDKSHFIAPSIYKEISNYSVSDFNSAEAERVKRLVAHMAATGDDEYVLNIFTRIMDTSSSYYTADLINDCSMLFYAMLADPFCNKALLTDDAYNEGDYSSKQLKSNRMVFKRCLKGFEKSKKEVARTGCIKYDYDDTFKVFYAVVRDDKPLMLRYFAAMNDSYTEMELGFLRDLGRDTEILKSDPDAVMRICLNLDKTEFSALREMCLKLYFSSLPADFRVRTIEQYKNILIDETVLDGLPAEDQRKLVFRLEPTDSAITKVINDVLPGADPDFIGRYLVGAADLMLRSPGTETVRLMLKTASELPDSRLLYCYLAYRMRENIRESSVPAAGEYSAEINRYFRRKWEFAQKGSKLECSYNVITPGEKTVLSVDESDGSFRFPIFPDHYTITSEEIKKNVISGEEHKWESAGQEQADRIAREAFSVKNRDFTKDMAALQESFASDEPIILSKDVSANIEYSFWWKDGSAALSFRIGIGRYYQVKDALEFVKAFKSGATVSYGKELTLTHDFENISESDAAAMRMLTAGRLASGKSDDKKNKRYVTLPDTLFASLITSLKGRDVIFNEIKASIRLADHPVSVSISKGYRLLTSVKADESALIIGTTGFIAVNEGGKAVIDRISNSPDEIRLINFFLKHGNVSIKPILNEFRSTIFSRYASFISVDSALKNDFRLSNVRICAHFDYEGSIITCRKEYSKDEVTVAESELTPRDLDRVRILDTYLSSLGFDDEGLLTDDGLILSFFRMDFSRLRSLCTVFLSESLMNKKLVSVSRQIFRISYNSGMMELFLEKSEFSEEELAAIINGLKKKKKFIQLKDNRIIDLDNEEAREFGETVSDFGMEADNLYAKRPVPMATAIKAFAHQRNCHVDKYLRNMIDDLRAFKSADIKLPSLNAKLRGYQIEGFNWLSILSEYGLGGILADDMGLGKTIQMIALIKSDMEKKPSLIVCPKSLVFNWKSEIMKFDGKTEAVEIYGPESQRSAIIESIDPGKKVIYITSYDSLRSDISKYAVNFRYAVLDEAQYIRNIYAQKTKSVKSIDAERRFALTGTPIENSVIDLWSIFDFLMPGYLEDVNVFKSGDHEAIRRKVAPFILRRTKQDVLTDLPPKYERILSTEMDKEQRKVYEAERDRAAKILASSQKAFDVLPYLTRLRQLCIDPSLYIENYTGGSSKLALLDTMIPEYIGKGHRILVFSQFVKALELLGCRLEKNGIKYFMLSGDTPAKKRVEMMNDFNEGDGPDVFLISLKAGGTGLNLTGADTVIHIDPWWNAAAEDQADDRTHRIGQKRNVEVIKLIAEDSIEQRVLELQEMKKDIIDKVISNDDTSVSGAKLEDIAFILRK